MSRKKEINRAAVSSINNQPNGYFRTESERNTYHTGFVMGARWADEHQNISDRLVYYIEFEMPNGNPPGYLSVLGDRFVMTKYNSLAILFKSKVHAEDVINTLIQHGRFSATKKYTIKSYEEDI